MATSLRRLAFVVGVACALIGLFHFGLGVDSVPGEGSAGATVDSRERFYGAIFAGYGLAWIWAARRSPVSSSIVRTLAGVLLAGGVGRLVSLAVLGPPQWFQVVLTVVELLLPPVLWWLAPADERAGMPCPSGRPTRNLEAG